MELYRDFLENKSETLRAAIVLWEGCTQEESNYL